MAEKETAKRVTAKEANQKLSDQRLEKDQKVIGLNEKMEVIYLQDFGGFKAKTKRKMGVIKANFFIENKIVKAV